MKIIKRLINEGGLAGHMTHPYDVLTIDNFISFYDDLLSGNIETSEKVDGTQLTVGINNSGDVVFARNKTEKPSTNIESKFPISHPGGDAFRAGFAAIKEGLSRISKSDRIKFHLINKDGTTKNYLNLEILYGTIPNLIQYSETDNYIVFHGWFKGPEDNFAPDQHDRSLLTELAEKINSVKVKSEVVTFYGNIGSVKRDIKVKESNWIFKGPITISHDRIKTDLQKVASKWKSLPEVKTLVSKKNELTQDQIFSLMKSLTAKIGSQILLNLASDLFSGTRKTPSNFPKIEGLVTQYKGNTLKITGDFAALNQELWKPLKDGLDKHIKEFNFFIMNDILGVKGVASITPQSWNVVRKNGQQFLSIKGDSKFYSDKNKMLEKLDKSSIKSKIDETLNKLQKQYEEVLKDEKNVKRDEIVKAIRLGSFKIQQFRDELSSINTRVDLVEVFARTMFGL
jgi:hypothetical protein